MITVTLKPGREGPLLAGHPWVFSGAIATIDGNEPPGSLARVRAANGSSVGLGYVNTRCSIAVRILSRANAVIDAGFIHRRLAAARALRRAVVPPETTGYRLVNGEGDFLPGIVVDVYDRFLVCQFLTAGAERLKSAVIDALVALLTPQGIYEKSEGNVRREEGLVNSSGVLWGEKPPPLLSIEEQGCRFWADVRGGQKTGFFFDQRENRSLARTLAAGRRVLNGFAYTGGFGIAAFKGGADHVVSVESTESALQLAQQNCDINMVPQASYTFVQADMFSYLRKTAEVFDLIILDPPPFIRRRQDRHAGMKGYKEINLQAFRLLASGGNLLTFSCSQHLSTAEFFHTVGFAAADSRREVRVLRQLGPAPDHPVNLAHPEGIYLKGLWLRVGGLQ
jgi:23S rRNA (cytosine1962-C5)-methyltransferase